MNRLAADCRHCPVLSIAFRFRQQIPLPCGSSKRCRALWTVRNLFSQLAPRPAQRVLGNPTMRHRVSIVQVHHHIEAIRLEFLQEDILGLLGRVWVEMGMKSPQSLTGSGFQGFDGSVETGTILRWLIHANASGLLTHTGFPVFDLWRKSAVYSASPPCQYDLLHLPQIDQ